LCPLTSAKHDRRTLYGTGSQIVSPRRARTHTLIAKLSATQCPSHRVSRSSLKHSFAFHIMSICQFGLTADTGASSPRVRDRSPVASPGAPCTRLLALASVRQTVPDSIARRACSPSIHGRVGRFSSFHACFGLVYLRGFIFPQGLSHSFALDLHRNIHSAHIALHILRRRCSARASPLSAMSPK